MKTFLLWVIPKKSKAEFEKIPYHLVAEAKEYYNSLSTKIFHQKNLTTGTTGVVIKVTSKEELQGIISQYPLHDYYEFSYDDVSNVTLSEAQSMLEKGAVNIESGYRRRMTT